MTRNQILLANREKFKKKWHPLLAPNGDPAQVSFKPNKHSTFQDIPVNGLKRFVEFVQ